MIERQLSPHAVAALFASVSFLVVLPSLASEPVANSFRFPVTGDIGDWDGPLRGFGDWICEETCGLSKCGYHLAKDIAKPANTTLVYPTAPGTVRIAQKIVGYTVVIEHLLADGKRVCSVYYHMTYPTDPAYAVHVGQAVYPETPLGSVSGNPEDFGGTENSVPHLHFGIRLGAYEPECDPRTHVRYYPGYTSIFQAPRPEDGPRCNNGIRDTCSRENQYHNAILAEWSNPKEFILAHQASPLPTLTLAVAPAQTLVPVDPGTQITFTCTVKANGTPVAGASIPVADPVTGQSVNPLTTDANGQKSYVVTAHQTGNVCFGPATKSGYNASGATAECREIIVNTPNQSPVASSQTVTVAFNTATAIMLTATDPDNGPQPLTYSIVLGPTHGTLTGSGAGRTYTPTTGYSGPDSFTFKANDGAADSNVATVSITVTSQPNQPPVAQDQSVSVAFNTAKAITLVASDADGNTLTYSIVAHPSHGTLGSVSGASVTYTPTTGYTGPDSFTFRAYDGRDYSAIAVVSITVSQGAHDWQMVQPSSPDRRNTVDLVYDSDRERSVVFGGSVGFTPLGDTWEWDGTQWHMVFTKDSPSARYKYGMTYDSDRHRTVLFGGYGGAYFGDTWEFDGQNWQQLSPTHTPSPRSGHKLTYDSTRHRVVLFGGGQFGNETWEWDGTDWISTQPITSPSNGSIALAFDVGRQVTVLYLGNFGTNTNETWEWDGTQWMQRNIESSYRHNGAALAYDTVQNKVVRFGGGESPSIFAWNGSNWTQKENSTLAVRRGHGLTFDNVRNRLVMFGGYVASELGDTWEFDGNQWLARNVGCPLASDQSTSYAITYDSNRHISILFGHDYLGSTWQSTGVTWETDGADWHLRSVTGPAPRHGQGIAYDSGRQVTVMAGGWVGSTGTRETWEWDGNTWLIRAFNGPSADTYMDYDSFRQKVVATEAFFGLSLWEWDGTQWSSKGDAPVIVSGYDPVRHRIYGFRTNNSRLEMWGWDGAIWELQTYRDNTTAPRYVVYDTTLSRIVLVYETFNQCNTVGYTVLEWDGQIWTNPFTFASTIPICNSPAVYDSFRNCISVFANTLPSCCNSGGGTSLHIWSYSRN
ncbi:MAG: cadherin-like domain-containing protein [Planctomycetes bacterium]|nr:cadherin-like domain-containing protein [Planctomycetota bacterium]